MNVSLVLQNAGLSADHFSALGTAVSEGYAALASLSTSIPMLCTSFLPGHRSLGALRNVAVQHALHLKAKDTGLFDADYGWNVIHNHAFLQLNCKKVRFTAHYLGPRGTRGIRKAVYRSELQVRNGDLFAAERRKAEIHHSGDIYAHIVHGGLEKPLLAAIRIPNRDCLSRKLGTTFNLEVIEPSTAKVEEVKDRIAETMKKRKKDRKERDAS